MSIEETARQEEPLINRSAPVILLVTLTAACLLPFIGKAFAIDEPLFLWAAKQIQEHPSDPYGFSVNWYGTEMPMSEVTKNPPLTSYYIALIASLSGWNEAGLRLAFLLPAIGVVVGTYLVAARFCRRPFGAGLCALSAPAFLVSSNTVMSDTMMLAFWMFAVYFWLSGMEKKSPAMLVLSSLLIPLCALTKYFGISLIPLLLLYSVVERRRVGWWATYMLIAVAVLVCYQWMTHALYGRGLLLDAASYATGLQTQFAKWSLSKTLIGLAFSGGCTAVVLFFSTALWSRKVLLAGAACTVLLALIVRLDGTVESYPIAGGDFTRWLVVGELAIFAAGGVGLLALSVLDLVRHQDAESFLLFAWITGTFLFAAFVNWSVNGRSILPMIPAAGILIMRRIEAGEKPGQGARPPRVWIPLAGATALSLAVTWSDCVYANTARQAANDIRGKYGGGGRSVLFQGHWGFQYYMELWGAKPIDRNQPRPDLSVVVVVPKNNTSRFPMHSAGTTLRETIDIPSSRWLTTMDPLSGSGFYSEIRGPLPFVVGRTALERYEIFDVSPEALR
jgi:4-amino-4-deoxy-L-arabinose transferase-like glycosyltransferase